jgi:uncharacterized protein
MKLQPDKFDVQSISGYGSGWISMKDEKIHQSVIIGSRGERANWECSRFTDLKPFHFEKLASFRPELIIFGSGASIRFLRPEFFASLNVLRIGLETMDTQAACRTYNILAGEGRHVIAALLIESDSVTQSGEFSS